MHKPVCAFAKLRSPNRSFYHTAAAQYKVHFSVHGLRLISFNMLKLIDNVKFIDSEQNTQTHVIKLYFHENNSLGIDLNS